MRLGTRILALALCVILLLGLCGCLPVPVAQDALDSLYEELQQTQTPQEQAPAGQVQEIETLAGDGYFAPLAREERSYDEMQLGEITCEAYAPYCEAITAAAEENSQEAFHRACFEAEQMLVKIDTAASLLALESDRDATDEALAERALRQTQAYYDAADLYHQTLHEISEGEHSRLLSREFETWQVEIFKSYDQESSQESLDLGAQESELVRQYAALSAQEELDVDAAADVYLELVKVRSQMAELAGNASYADYAYSAFYSRDYTPEDAQKIWQTAKEDFAPLLTKYSDTLSQALSDSGISSTGGITGQNVIDALLYGTARMSPEVREAAEYLIEHSLYDISYSEKKLPTGYTSYLYSFDVPFIFNCPYDSYADYTDMFHEFGHWLAGYYHGSDALYGVIDYDLSELQSQGMEVMFLQFYEDLFGDDAEILRAQTLLNLVYSVVTGAMYDEFQQRIYAESDLTKDRLLDIYREVYASYGFEPYDGYEYEWTEVIHNFQQPLYYISYAVSAIPALELYARLAESPNDAMDTYLRVASMSDEDYFLTDALRETGLTNSMKSPIGDVIARELEESGAFDIS